MAAPEASQVNTVDQAMDQASQDDQASLTGDSVNSLEVLESKTVSELKELAKSAGLTGYSNLRKAELIEVLMK